MIFSGMLNTLTHTHTHTLTHSHTHTHTHTHIHPYTQEEGIEFKQSDGFTPSNTMDRWIISFTQSLISFMKEEMASEWDIQFHFQIVDTFIFNNNTCTCRCCCYCILILLFPQSIGCIL